MIRCVFCGHNCRTDETYREHLASCKEHPAVKESRRLKRELKRRDPLGDDWQKVNRVRGQLCEKKFSGGGLTEQEQDHLFELQAEVDRRLSIVHPHANEGMHDNIMEALQRLDEQLRQRRDETAKLKDTMGELLRGVDECWRETDEGRQAVEAAKALCAN